jgi:hypothetical protein
MAGGTSLIGSGAAAAAPATGSATAARSPGGPYNMVFILTDPERYFRPGELPKDYVLPAHKRLARAADTSRPCGDLACGHRANAREPDRRQPRKEGGDHPAAARQRPVIAAGGARSKRPPPRFAMARSIATTCWPTSTAGSWLNALIEREVGEDVGQMLPGGVDGGRVVTDTVYDV